MNARRYRTQTVSITMVAGVADGTLQEANITFDQNYDSVVGVAAVERTASGIAYQLGFKSPRGSELDLAASDMFRSTLAVAPDQKYIKLGSDGSGFPVVNGEVCNVQLKNVSGAVVPAGGITIDFVFKLVREEVKANA